MMVVLIGFWLLLLLVYMFFSTEFPRPQWKLLLVFSFFSFLFILPLVFPLLQDAILNRNSSFVVAVDESIRTEITSIFIPDWFIRIKRSIYLGIMPFCLFILAARYMKREGKLWFLLIGLSFLFAIGPVPTFLGKELGIVLPWSLAIIPFLRNTYRMLLLFSLGWAMITAFGWVALQNTLQLSKIKMISVALIVGLLIFGEYTISPFPTTPTTVSRFYSDYLANVPDNVALAILPTGRQEGKRYLYYQSVHQHPITGGFIARAEEKTLNYIENNPILRAGAVDLEPVPIPDNIEDGFRQLAEIHGGYLVLDKALMDNEEEWREAIPFVPIYEDDLLIAYETGLN
ncbi:MAG: hypothetical protein WAM60_26630 [Candidatus Promineifilaceae bacterium]